MQIEDKLSMYSSCKVDPMTTLKQLNQLAKECEVCALEDSRSINQHLKECGTCGDYREKAEIFNETLNDIRHLASKEEFVRHRELHMRISKMATMDEDERVESFTGLLDAIAILPEDDRIKMVKTRTDVLVDFPKYERDPMIRTMSEVVKEWDKDRKRSERIALNKATEGFPVYKKLMIRNLFGNLME
jgi:hypothetical protein